MTTYPSWLLDLFRDQASETKPEVPHVHDPTRGLLELARRLARNGHLHDAEREYAHLSRTHGTPEIWLEHAEVQLAIGERFGAAANATRVLALEPGNSRALGLRDAALTRAGLGKNR
jgi:hypothetical protein